MDVLLNFFQEFINLGAAVMLPVVIAILGLFFRMKAAQAIKSGLLVGIGFQGLCLAVGLLTTTIQPVMDYYETIGSGYDVLEIGFAALGGAAWTVPFAVFAIPAIVIVNLVLVRLKVTKVLNVDIWNYMHFLVPGALAYALFGSALLGFLVTVALSVITLFFSQWAAPEWEDFYGLEGTTCTTLAFAAWIYPVSKLINKVIDKIPGLNKVDVDMDKIGSKLGILGDPAVIGLVVGAFLSLLTRQSVGSMCTICMGVAAVMVLIPRMVGIMMEGLSPLGSAANQFMKKSIGEDAEIYIGMDIALGLGDPCCITCTAIIIPLTVLMAFVIPDMRFFPLGILAEVCYLAPMCVLTSKGNVFRTLVTMGILMFATLFFANLFAPEATQMMAATSVSFDGMVTASHFGWNPGNLIVCLIHKLIGG